LKNLKKKYGDYRKIRRDGSCFYRAFLFRLSEYLIKSKDKALLDSFYDKVKDKKFLMDAGFEEFVIEDFQQVWSYISSYLPALS
jgi:ubiquitin thioesterase protein OTUB1